MDRSTIIKGEPTRTFCSFGCPVWLAAAGTLCLLLVLLTDHDEGELLDGEVDMI